MCLFKCPGSNGLNTRFCRETDNVLNTRFFGLVWTQILLRQSRFDSDFTQISEQKIGASSPWYRHQVTNIANKDNNKNRNFYSNEDIWPLCYALYYDNCWVSCLRVLWTGFRCIEIDCCDTRCIDNSLQQQYKKGWTSFGTWEMRVKSSWRS